MDECRVKPAQRGKDPGDHRAHPVRSGLGHGEEVFVDGKEVKEVKGMGDDAFSGWFMGYNAGKGAELREGLRAAQE
jgi:hypothetical protein